MTKPTPCANVGGVGSSRSVGGARRGRTSRAEQQRRTDGAGCRRKRPTRTAARSRAARRTPRRPDRRGRGRSSRSSSTAVIPAPKRGLARVDAVRGAGDCGSGRGRGGIRLSVTWALPMRSSSAARRSSRRGAPPMRARTTPAPSTRNVVGVCRMLYSRASSGRSVRSISTCATPSRSALSSPSTTAVLRQGAQNSVENWSRVAADPNGCGRVDARRRHDGAGIRARSHAPRARPPEQPDHCADGDEAEHDGEGGEPVHGVADTTRATARRCEV